MPSTRSNILESVIEIECDTSKKKKYQSSWMFIAKDDVFQENSSVSIISLKHPGHMKNSKYILNKSSKKLYEIQTFNEPFRSWLIDESVKSDGKIYLSMPIDPLLIVLPYLKKQCSQRAIPLEHILESAEDHDLIELTGLVTDLTAIADIKGPADLCAYKYNEEKVLKWLEAKVRRVSEVLKKKNMYVKSGAVSSTFVASTLKQQDVDDDFYLKYAYGIVCEYLDEELCQTLHKHLNIKEEQIASLNNKRKSTQATDDSSDSKRIKTESKPSTKPDADENLQNAPVNFTPQPKPTKPVVLSTKEKQMQKAAKGSKSISSFFTKK